MSSVSEKSMSSTPTKVRFLRSTSFQKLCLAAYPMQLAGSICTRETLKQLVETVLCTAKSWMQKLFLTTSFSVFSFWRSTVSWLLRVLTAVIGVDEAVFIEYLKYERQLSEQAKTYSVEHTLKNEKLLDHLSPSPGFDPTHVTECLDETLTTIGKLSAKALTTKSSIGPIPQTDYKRIVMSVFVYGSTVFAYIQLMVLLMLVNNSSQTPPGLIFLIMSLGFVGYVVAKISFMKKPIRSAVKIGSTRVTNNNQPQPNCNNLKDHKLKPVPLVVERQSRVKTRPSIYLTLAEQRLSKIKLL